MKQVQPARTDSLAELGRLYHQESAQSGIVRSVFLHDASSSFALIGRGKVFHLHIRQNHNRGVIPGLCVTPLLHRVSQSRTGRPRTSGACLRSEPIIALSGPRRIRMSFFCRCQAAGAESPTRNPNRPSCLTTWLRRETSEDGERLKMFDATVRQPHRRSLYRLTSQFKKRTSNQTLMYPVVPHPQGKSRRTRCLKPSQLAHLTSQLRSVQRTFGTDRSQTELFNTTRKA